MAPLKISLSGHSAMTRQPERSILRFRVTATGPNRENVTKEVTETSNEVNRLFKELSPKAESGETIANAPVTAFSSTSLQTQSYTPYKEKEKCHSATISLTANFQDFVRLNEVVGKLVTYSNVEIQSLEWRLTEATQNALGSESRKEAMRDAVRKANDYAEVVGRQVVAVEIQDGSSGAQSESAGFYGMNRTARQQALMQQMQQQVQQQPQSSNTLSGAHQFSSHGPNVNAALESSPALDLSPQLIRYTSSVNVQFEAVSDM